MTVPLARRNLLHQRGKLLLSALGIAAALTLVLLLFGFRAGMFSAISAYIDRSGADLIVAQAQGQGSLGASRIPAAIHSALASSLQAVDLDHVLLADVIFTQNGFKTPISLVGYNTETGIGGPWSLGEGRPVGAENEIVLDTWLARRAQLRVEDTVEILGQTFQIVGLSRETSSWLGSYIFISREAAEDLLDLPGMASFYLLRLPENADIAATAESIGRQIDGVDVLTPAERASLSWKLLGSVLNAPVNLMLLIGVLTGVAVMALTAYTGVIDRIREFGVLRAVGASQGWLRRLALTETVVRALLGFVLGTVMSYVAAAVIMQVFPQFLITISAEIVALAAVMTLGMALVASWLPLRRIAAIDPAIVFKA